MSLRDGEFGYHELERVALGFVTEAETWPVFLAWCKTTIQTEAAAAWLEDASLNEARKMWAEHSPDDYIRALAETLP